MTDNNDQNKSPSEFADTSYLFALGVAQSADAGSVVEKTGQIEDPSFNDLAELVENRLLRNFWFGGDNKFDKLKKYNQKDYDYLLAIIQKQPFNLLEVVKFTNNWEYRQIESLVARLEKKFAKEFDVSIISEPALAILDKFDQASVVFDQADWKDKVNPFVRNWLAVEKDRKPGILNRVFNRLYSFLKDKSAHSSSEAVSSVKNFLDKILAEISNMENKDDLPKKSVNPKPVAANNPPQKAKKGQNAQRFDFSLNDDDLDDDDLDDDEFELEEDEPSSAGEGEGEGEGEEEVEEPAEKPAELAVDLPVIPKTSPENLAKLMEASNLFDKDHLDFMFTTVFQHGDIVLHFKKQLEAANLLDLFEVINTYKPREPLPDLLSKWDDLWEMFALSVVDNLNNLWVQYKDQDWLKILAKHLHVAGKTVSAGETGGGIKNFAFSKDLQSLRQYVDIYSALWRLSGK